MTWPLIHRQIGAPSLVSSKKPIPRSLSEKSAYSAYEAISAIASTSNVGRTLGAAGSVMSNPVAQPPTNTSSFSSGLSKRAAAISRSILVSRMNGWPEPGDDHFLGKFALAGAAIAKRVHQRQVFVE